MNRSRWKRTCSPDHSMAWSTSQAPEGLYGFVGGPSSWSRREVTAPRAWPKLAPSMPSPSSTLRTIPPGALDGAAFVPDVDTADVDTPDPQADTASRAAAQARTTRSGRSLTRPILLTASAREPCWMSAAPSSRVFREPGVARGLHFTSLTSPL